jgi:two-component system nitrogen regulation response regulator NtrX
MDMYQATVLLVLEGESSRNALAQLLVHEGFLVLTAASGHDALGVFRAAVAPVNVLVLNLPLPDLDGANLCACLQREHTNQPVVVCTGEADSQEKLRLSRLGVKCFLQRPVRLEDLVSAIRHAVHGRQEGSVRSRSGRLEHPA